MRWTHFSYLVGQYPYLRWVGIYAHTLHRGEREFSFMDWVDAIVDSITFARFDAALCSERAGDNVHKYGTGSSLVAYAALWHWKNQATFSNCSFADVGESVRQLFQRLSTIPFSEGHHSYGHSCSLDAIIKIESMFGGGTVIRETFCLFVPEYPLKIP